MDFRSMLTSYSEIAENKPVVVGPPVVMAQRVSRLLTIKAGYALTARKSWSNMTLSILRGSCRIETETGTEELRTGQQFDVPAHLEHQISAVEDTKAVVTFDSNQ